MSEKNVEIVRRSYEAWNAGREEGGRPTWTADCEWHDPPDFPDPAVYRGPDAVAKHLDDMWGALGVVQVSDVRFDRLVPIGDDEVLVLFSLEARGSSSGVPLEVSLGNLVQVRDGKVCRWRAFSSQEAALEAAGLSE